MKSLNILLGCDNLKSTGSGSSTRDMNNELLRRGHNVDLFTFNNGLLGEGLPNIVTEIADKYDLLILQHKNIVDEIIKLEVEGFKIYNVSVVLDYFDKNYFPNELKTFEGLDVLITLTTESQNILEVESKLIFWGIDCNRFSPKAPIRKDNPRILSMVRSESANEMIKQACNILNVEFISWLKPYDYESFTEQGSVDNVQDWINKSDIVIGIGRAVYETMACGRQPIIFDDRWYQGNCGDGIVTPDNIENFISCNCSGRYTDNRFDASTLAFELQKYNPDYSEFFREFALKNLNIVNTADKVIEIYDRL